MLNRNQRIVILLLVLITSSICMGQSTDRGIFHVGLSAGMGLPQIPISEFRSAISVTGGGLANLRISSNWMIQADLYGLYSFGLGTMTGTKKKLKFNLLWGSMNLMYAIRKTITGESFVSMGFGQYNLDQCFGTEELSLKTAGMNIGIINHRHWRRVSGVFEIKWHLLFRPSSNPQCLVMTLGFMI